ncbi:hypothetical protein [Lactobacillus taiwanensis]|uniref:hypothetical protein n=1 Tax=Lactobacillus taiwanensis TaxID=508451 RepID=UPI002731A4E6|nr:hypothetical protein [Lactobacillus taiwanensis]
MDDIIAERKRKAEKIIKSYSRRENRQEDIAKKFEIPTDIVRNVTQAYGFEHGKKKSTANPNNLNDGQRICPIIKYDEMDYLDKYNF